MAFIRHRHKTPSCQFHGLIKLNNKHAASWTISWTEPVSMHKLLSVKSTAILIKLSVSYLYLRTMYFQCVEPHVSPKYNLGKTALKQGCTNSGLKVAAATTFCTKAPNILGPQYGTCFVSSFGA